MADRKDHTKQNIVEYLNRQKHTAWQQQTVGVRGRRLPASSRGIGDICACLRPRGIHFEVELKRKGDRIRDEQFAHLCDIRRAGGFYIIVQDFDDFCQQFDKIRKLIF